MDANFIQVTSLMFFLLNPLFMSIYLMGFFKSLDEKTFTRVIIRGVLIALIIFCSFALMGDRVFTDFLHSRFLCFQIFGGIIFLVIGFRMVFEGDKALSMWREEPAQISGAVTMPFFIGPGTIMASVMAGASLTPVMAIFSIFISMTFTCICLLILKKVYDHVNSKEEQLVQGYINIVGRVMALVVGTFSVEMILKGIETWVQSLP